MLMDVCADWLEHRHCPDVWRPFLFSYPVVGGRVGEHWLTGLYFAYRLDGRRN